MNARLPMLLTLVAAACLGSGCDEAPTPASGPGQARPTAKSAPLPSQGDRSEAPRSAAPRGEAAPAQRAGVGEDRTPAPLAEQSTPASRAARQGGPVTGINDALAGTSKARPLELKTSVEPLQGKWVARWTLTNVGEEPIFVVAQLPTFEGGKPVPAPHKLYVRPQGETLHLTKRFWRVPTGVMPLVREEPYLQRLDPGQSIEGGLRLPSSVAASFPYGEPSSGRAHLVSEVVVSFGYFTAEAQPTPVGGGLYQVSYAQLDSQGFVKSEPHPARLTVR